MKRTYLRHAMLHACSVGRVRIGGDNDREWTVRSTVSTYPQLARALNWLLDNGLARGIDGVLQPTPDGVNTLYGWDSRYGAVSEVSRG
jgi:hypothetical protein